MANRDVTNDAENDDKTVPTGADKVLIIDVSTSPDSLKEVTLTNIFDNLSVVPELPSLYKLSVTVSASDLIVALKTTAGADPSANDPLYFKIGYTLRSVTAATSITLADATNWFGLGGAQFATIQQELFAYVVWDSNSSVVAVSCARIPNGRLVSDFNSTNTNEKYLGNYANFTSTDEVANVGRFAATLSATAAFTWTVPTFTNANLIHEPIYETSVLTYDPTLTGFSSDPTGNYDRYFIRNNVIGFITRSATGGTSNATTFTVGLPFTAKTVTDGTWQEIIAYEDNGTNSTTPGRIAVVSAGTTGTVRTNMTTGAWTNSSTKRVVAMDWLEYEY